MNSGDEHKQHFLLLDGLRGIAALCVLAFHFNSWFSPYRLFADSYLAVDFFFMLSGFVIAYAYGQKLQAGMGSAASWCCGSCGSIR